MDPWRGAFLAACGGLFTQRMVSGIPEVSTTKAIALYIAGNCLLGFTLKACGLRGASEAAVHILTVNSSYLSSLILSTLIYRVYFHPLRSFPGSRLASLSKLYEAFINFQGRNALVVRDLHRQHGDFIRTGPNELAINNVDAVEIVFARTQPSARGPMYEASKLQRAENLWSQRSREVHTAWRRIWSKGFTPQTITSYSPRVEYHVQKMIAILKELGGKEANVVNLCSNLAFDVMADLGFGRDPAETLQGGTGDPEYIGFIHGHLTALSVFMSLRNLCDLGPYIPKDQATKAFQGKGEKMLNERKKLGKSRQDILMHLLGEDSETGTAFTHGQLCVNAELVVVAGSDTVSFTFICILRQLALSPEIQQKLRSEIPRSGTSLTCANTANLPYLGGVINEILRLWPAVPSGAQAVTPPAGYWIAGTYVPGNVAVRINHYAIMTDERYFSRPTEFIPERWTTESHLVIDKRAFIPFSYGAHSCIGRALALNELRLAVASIVQRFEIRPGRSYDNGEFLGGWREHFGAIAGPCILEFAEL